MQTEQLRQWIADGVLEPLLQVAGELHPADMGEQLAGLTPEEVARFVEMLGTTNALTVFEFVPFDLQKAALGHLSKKTLAELMHLMSPDDRADLVEELDERSQERLLSLLMQAERQNIMKLITYPEGCAGAYLTTDYAFLRMEGNIRGALDQLRLQAPKKETIYYAYVVDQARRLVGFVSLRDLIMGRSEDPISSVIRRSVISVRVSDDIEYVAQEMTHYDFLAIPVVDHDDRLVGIITYDDIFDVISEEATEDMYHLANLDTDEKISSSLPRSVKLRIPWLLVNLLTALVASMTVSYFSDTISKYVILAALMPIVAGLGGNFGTQTLTVVVRALALGEIKFTGDWGVLFKQIGVGLCSGLFIGLVMGGIAFLWHHNIWLSLILWMAMTANLILAGLVGALVPIILRKLKLDPALGSSIFVTMTTDTGGFFIFLGLASLLLHHIVV